MMSNFIWWCNLNYDSSIYIHNVEVVASEFVYTDLVYKFFSSDFTLICHILHQQYYRINALSDGRIQIWEGLQKVSKYGLGPKLNGPLPLPPKSMDHYFFQKFFANRNCTVLYQTCKKPRAREQCSWEFSGISGNFQKFTFVYY